MILKNIVFLTGFLSLIISGYAADKEDSFFDKSVEGCSLFSYTEEDIKFIQMIFDPDYYLSSHGSCHAPQTLTDSCSTELHHFMEKGWIQNYNPNCWFNLTEYKKHFPGKGNPVLEWVSQTSGINKEKFSDSEVIVSVTTHPPRIGTTWLSLTSLLNQSVKPNRVILYLAADDFPDRKIPQSLEILKKRGLEVRFSEKNYKVATKLLPALKDFPNATIITADDDRIYDKDLLKILLKAHTKHPKNIITPSAREYLYSGSGLLYQAHIAKYLSQHVDFYIDYLRQKMIHNEREAFGIFEGFAGVLYPPHAFNDEVFNFDKFKLLTPHADDVWFQAMAILNGTMVRGLSKELTDRLKWPVEIDDTQAVGLFHAHLHANDWMAYRAFYYYGLLSKIGIPEYANLNCQTCKRKVILYSPSDMVDSCAVSLPTHKKNRRCPTCLNTAPKKVLHTGRYDHGDFLETFFDVFQVPDTKRVNRLGEHIDFHEAAEDLEFDAFIFNNPEHFISLSHNPSANYYIALASKSGKPCFFLNSGGLKQIKSITKFLLNNGESVKPFTVWDDENRNVSITRVKEKYTGYPIPQLQAMSNVELYKILTEGPFEGIGEDEVFKGITQIRDVPIDDYTIKSHITWTDEDRNSFIIHVHSKHLHYSIDHLQTMNNETLYKLLINGPQIPVRTCIEDRKIGSPTTWSDVDRNSFIIHAHGKHSHYSIDHLQAMSNESLYELLINGPQIPTEENRSSHVNKMCEKNREYSSGLFKSIIQTPLFIIRSIIYLPYGIFKGFVQGVTKWI